MKFVDIPADQIEELEAAGTSTKVDLSPIVDHFKNLKNTIKDHPEMSWQEVETDETDDELTARKIKVRLSKAAKLVGGMEIKYPASQKDGSVKFHVVLTDPSKKN